MIKSVLPVVMTLAMAPSAICSDFSPNYFYPFSLISPQACGMSVDAGEDQVACSSGESVALNAVITGGPYLDMAWEPAAAVNQPASPNTTATVVETTTFTVSVRSLSPDNLIVNGDFSLGDQDFTSDYIYGTGGGVGLLSNEGQYAIADNAGDTHNQFANCSDHTGGGNMMVVNASGQLDNVWCQVVEVEMNTDYNFSAWVTSVVSQNPARLQFSINGGLLGNVFNAPSATCNWSQFSAQWFSGSVSTAEICIVNVNQTPSGNDFAMDDISIRRICTTTDTVTVTVADLSADWTAPAAVCQNELAFVLDELLNETATPNGEWTIDGIGALIFNPGQLSPGPHLVSYQIAIGNCTLEQEHTITVNAVPFAGMPAEPVSLCSNEQQVFQLADFLEDEDAGGSWTESSPTPSTGSAFNPGAGTFNTTGQAAGTYTFDYTLDAPDPCPDATATVTVILEETPVADAGPDQSLDCTVSVLNLGGPGTTQGDQIKYLWEVFDGGGLDQPTLANPSVNQAGTYVLTVTNTVNGCASSDETIVESNITTVSATASVAPVSCSGQKDGSITVETVSGGDEPYLFSLNDQPFADQQTFAGLSAGVYSVRVMDANGCEALLELEVTAPLELVAGINTPASGNPPAIFLGDSIRLEVVVNRDMDKIDSIIWSPEGIACGNCTSIFVKPMETTTYTVRLIDNRGCTTTASITVLVNKLRRIYIPNVFSPNDDGFNDQFYINAGNDVAQIQSFQILDRWGNLLFEDVNFQPNDPAHGWDGDFNGQSMHTGVYVYFAKIEMKDGEILLEKGEVTLLR